MVNKFKIEWIDHGRDPQCKPDPSYPRGKTVDMATAYSAKQSCTVDLPYPAKRCGAYIVECALCGIRVGCTTAGRPDDPCKIIIACKVTDHVERKQS